MSRQIPLSGAKSAGLFVTVDDADYDALSAHRWCGRHDKRGQIYAVRRNGTRLESMHRIIAGEPEGRQVDHHDGNRLNNTRANLRVCSHAENARNRRGRLGRALPKGVYRARDRYKSLITSDGQAHYLGTFDTAAEAARAYDAAAHRLHGAFARPNALASPPSPPEEGGRLPA